MSSPTPSPFPQPTDTVLVGFSERTFKIPVAVRRADLAKLDIDNSYVGATNSIPNPYRVVGITSAGVKVYLAELPTADDQLGYFSNYAGSWLG